MADALHVELVAADRTVWSGEATMVIARTVDGDIGVLRNHAPLLSLLTDANTEIYTEDGGVVIAVVDGGFISVANNRVSILSERAILAEDVKLDQAKAELDEAQRLLGEDDSAERRIRRAESRIRAVERAS
jgi:F-type H+-transporting ATPase subunit epsilon